MTRPAPRSVRTAGASHLWQAEWFAHGAVRRTRAWRGVEAQHVVSTMRLVDTLDEQAVLEQLLERSKPPLPAGAEGKHYLLVTPFRYRPRHPSRFRRGGTLGLWYGAESLATACAEVAYWRWRFVTDSVGLQDEELLTEHSFFSAAVDGLAIDLMAPPWIAARALWTHPHDYGATQALAESAREAQVQWIRYESVRDPGGACVAVLDVAALDALDTAGQQTWHCHATRDRVRLVHGDDRYEWCY